MVVSRLLFCTAQELLHFQNVCFGEVDIAFVTFGAVESNFLKHAVRMEQITCLYSNTNLKS
jgi:hypothetical protein